MFDNKSSFQASEMALRVQKDKTGIEGVHRGKEKNCCEPPDYLHVSQSITHIILVYAPLIKKDMV